MTSVQRSLESAFSMLELMVALAIASLIVVAAMESFRMQNETYTVVDQSTEAQQNMRAIGDLIERDIRTTAMGVPEAVSACGIDNVNGPDTLFLTDGAAIQPFTGGGALAENRPLFAAVTNTPPTTGIGVGIQVDKLILEENLAVPPAAYGAADFQVGGGLILANSDQPSQGTACGIIQNIVAAGGGPGGTITVDFQTTNAVPFAFGEELMVVPAHVYQIAVNANGISELFRNGNLLASDVEDLQMAWFIDLNNDGQRDDNELFGSAAPGAQQYQAAGAAAPNSDHRLLREIRINLVVTTRDQDPGSSGGPFVQSGMQAMENRVFVLAPNDGFRRRVHTTTVRLRNVGFRGRMGKKIGI